MDGRNWQWRRKSSDKTPGETESSGSVSSHSEMFSDDQEILKSSLNDVNSPEVSSTIANCEENDTLKSLSEKLSAAFLKIRAKEDLVKQHAKVAEEAISGWEKADREVASLKQQLETAVQKNSVLEDKINILDDALKECVRQLRESREEQEQSIQDAVVRKNNEWESEKSELVDQIVELEAQLETAKEVSSSAHHDLQMKLELAEKENAILKSELFAQSEELNFWMLERELSTHAAETASKQHLESIKKVAKLEAECRRLRSIARRTSNDLNPFVNSVYVDSVTDSQSDSGERLLASDNEPSHADSWASLLLAELDQFKTVGRNPIASPAEIDLMDDFLEMEKLAASSEAEHDTLDSTPAIADTKDRSLNAETKILLHQKISELEEKIERMETEKADMEISLAQTQRHFEDTCNQLEEAERTVMDLQRQLWLANSSRQDAQTAAEAAEAKRKLLDSQLECANSKERSLQEKVCLLEGKIEEERALSADLQLKCLNLGNEVSKNKQEAETRRTGVLNEELKIKQKELAAAAGKLAECQKTIASLGHQLRSLKSLGDLMMDDEKSDLLKGSGIPEGQEKPALYKFDQSINPSTGLLNGKETRSQLLSCFTSSVSGFS